MTVLYLVKKFFNFFDFLLWTFTFKQRVFIRDDSRLLALKLNISFKILWQNFVLYFFGSTLGFSFQLRLLNWDQKLLLRVNFQDILLLGLILFFTEGALDKHRFFLSSHSYKQCLFLIRQTIPVQNWLIFAHQSLKRCGIFVVRFFLLFWLIGLARNMRDVVQAFLWLRFFNFGDVLRD